MNMFPKIHPFVSSLWPISAELYIKQPEALRLNDQAKGLIHRALWIVVSVLVALCKARAQRRAKELSSWK